MKATLSIALLTLVSVMSNASIAAPDTVKTKIAHQITENKTGIASNDTRLLDQPLPANPAGMPPAVKNKVARQIEQQKAIKAQLEAQRKARQAAAAAAWGTK